MSLMKDEKNLQWLECEFGTESSETQGETSTQMKRLRLFKSLRSRDRSTVGTNSFSTPLFFNVFYIFSCIY